jgi:hypothetical protein
VSIRDNRPLLWLNVATLGGLLAYVVGIYLHVVLLGQEWGNVLVVGTIAIAGRTGGIALVFVIYTLVLFITLNFASLRGLNLFLCWFWILSWYQCAINEFLYYFGLPNEPVNRFFKAAFPTLWYPAKELVFIALALLFTFLGRKKFMTRPFNIVDYALVALVSGGMLHAIVMSQISYLNR